MPPARATILRSGMVTPVGLGSAQSCLAIAAGVAAFETTAVHDKRFEPITMALFPDAELPELETSVAATPGLTARKIRMLRLATAALQEVLSGVDATRAIPLFLAGPEPLPARGAPSAAPFLQLLLQQAQVDLDLSTSRTFPYGRAAALLALQAAVDTIQRGATPRVLVGGVDSFLDLYLLGSLDMQDRIQTPSVLDGFIPGEAAAFVLVAAPDAFDAKSLADVVDVSSADEPGHRGSAEPYRGDGLASAVTLALQRASSLGPVRTSYTSLTGESFGAKEWGVAYLRNRPQFDEGHQIEHPADCIGDTGAAAGAVLLCLAAHALHDGAHSGPALVWAASDGPHRAAALLTTR